MKALLISPHKLIPKAFSITQKPSPPLGLAYIAAALEGICTEITVYDCIAEAPDHYFKFGDLEGVIASGIAFEEMFAALPSEVDLIGITIMFTNNWLINRHLIILLKEKYPNATIIAGGEHVSAIPEFCLRDCPGLDVVVVGEGEDTISELASKIAQQASFDQVTGIVFKDPHSSEIINNGKRARIKAVGTINRPAWHLFPLDKYFENKISYGIAYGNSLPIFSTRGCPFECTFCSSPQMWGTKYTMRDVDDVIEEIKHLYYTYDVRNIDFYDLTAIIKRQWIIDLCKRLEEENIHITWQIPAGTRSEAIDFEVAEALKKTGCANITYAPESGSPRTLKKIKKKVTIEKMLSSIQSSYKAGLNVKLNILLGYPDEQLSDIFYTIKFLIKASYYGAIDASPSIFSPYPGSALFRELEANKELKLDDEYFAGIITSQSLHEFENYNRNYSRTTLIFMLFLCYLSFYGSNYLFRPIRFFRLIRNLYTGKHETRGELMLSLIISRARSNKHV